MKRLLTACFFILFLSTTSKAAHISGGEMFYRFLSVSGNNYSYSVTLKLFRDEASSGPQLEGSQSIAIYEKGTNILVWSSIVGKTSETLLVLGSPNPCIISPPAVSFRIALYETSVTLPGSLTGYTIVFQRCCRLNNITNLVAPSSQFGSTYTAEIPGNEPISNAPANNSAKFIGVDTVITCAGYPFQYSFNAFDGDGDSLSYSFCSGYTNTNGTAPNPPAPPPYASLNYIAPYNGSFPLGSGVTIATNTGIVSGTAPVAGLYVVTVCVNEYRNGTLIATQRKDLHIRVSDCDLATVSLEPNGYINCNDYTVSFSNLSPSPLINSYFWDFGNLAALNDTSILLAPSYTYPDTGVYFVKVVANRNQPCSDSVTAPVRVFPGFFPNFNFAASCVNTPVQFFDLSGAAYGTVNFWSWNFGVIPLTNDTSRLQSPQYTYPTSGSYTTEFVVGSDKGCRDTIYNTVTVFDKPLINFTFRDTMICSVDTLQLQASGTGIFTWSPNYNLINPASSTPLVYPKITTWYHLNLNENGCSNQDSVRVRVVDFVTLSASNDTTICANDNVQLSANTNGLQYTWSPGATLSSAAILNPIASPAVNTTYQITSVIGGCTATEDIVINILPRPTVNAGNDITICFNGTAQLNAVHNGTSFTWSSPATLSNAAILNPTASPANTTTYILTVVDNVSGCPKPSMDTIIVTVLQEVIANAGRDTTIIAGLPLQLLATGGTSYLWSPATGLSDVNIAGPVALLDGNPGIITYQVLVTNQAGCADIDSFTVTIFKTGPEIFVPTGFTPNADGRNDIFRPIYVGMQTIDFFKVYNRWGKLIYSSNQKNGAGWDGTLNGIKQNTGTFIWQVRATDVLGKLHFKKGTVELIR